MTDAESLQQPYNPKSGWPYRCIVASIALLYLLFVGAAAWMLIAVFPSEVKSGQMPSQLQPSALEALTTKEKTKVFYLTPKSGDVKSQTMDWESSMPRTYDNVHHVFLVPRKGNYLLGVNLVLKCDSNCPSGSLKLNITSNNGDFRSCRMELEKEPSSCIHMLELPADSRLMVSMGVEVLGGAEKPEGTWSLDVQHSQWWIFISDE